MTTDVWGVPQGNPSPRPVLRDLPVYVAGRAQSGSSSQAKYKSSSNESPFPTLAPVVSAIESTAGTVARYPDMYSSELTQALSVHLGVPADHVLVGAGSIGLLQQALAAMTQTGDEVVFAWRSFEAYPILTAIAGSTPVRVPLTDGDAHDTEALVAAVSERTKMIILCSPNNPTGVAMSHAEVEDFLARVPSHVLVVIDEAYREYATGPDVLDGVEFYRRWPNVCVLRTFSKAYGLAGLRVGYAVAQLDVAIALRKTMVPFAVSVTAQTAALAALNETASVAKRVQASVRERARMFAELDSMGWVLPRSQANFLWLPLAEATDDFTRHCEDRGMLVRPYGSEGVRVTVSDAEANDAFLSIAREWLERTRPIRTIL